MVTTGMIMFYGGIAGIIVSFILLLLSFSRKAVNRIIRENEAAGAVPVRNTSPVERTVKLPDLPQADETINMAGRPAAYETAELTGKTAAGETAVLDMPVRTVESSRLAEQAEKETAVLSEPPQTSGQQETQLLGAASRPETGTEAAPNTKPEIAPETEILQKVIPLEDTGILGGESPDRNETLLLEDERSLNS